MSPFISRAFDNLGVIFPSLIRGTFLSITTLDSSKNEGNAGATAFTFSILRTGNLNVTSSVNWSVNSTGLSNPAAPSDFVGGVFPSGTANFGIGVDRVDITVNVAGDTIFEPDEAFRVVISGPVDAEILTGQESSSGSIINDDAAPPPPPPAPPPPPTPPGVPPLSYPIPLTIYVIGGGGGGGNANTNNAGGGGGGGAFFNSSPPGIIGVSLPGPSGGTRFLSAQIGSGGSAGNPGGQSVFAYQESGPPTAPPAGNVIFVVGCPGGGKGGGTAAAPYSSATSGSFSGGGGGGGGGQSGGAPVAGPNGGSGTFNAGGFGLAGGGGGTDLNGRSASSTLAGSGGNGFFGNNFFGPPGNPFKNPIGYGGGGGGGAANNSAAGAGGLGGGGRGGSPASGQATPGSGTGAGGGGGWIRSAPAGSGSGPGRPGSPGTVVVRYPTGNGGSTTFNIFSSNPPALSATSFNGFYYIRWNSPGIIALR